MDRKEYLTNMFKRDFLQYSLLQDDSLPAKEIADKVYDSIDLSGLISRGKEEIESLCDKYLSFEKVKIDGRLSNELSEELDYGLKDRVLAEYKGYLDRHPTEAITDDVISKIERRVELQTWSNGISNMPEAMRLLVGRLNNSARSYANLYTVPISESDMLDKFNRAKKNTFFERIQGSNIDDILEYRRALMEYVRVSCVNMLYAKIEDVYIIIANHAVIGRLQSKFSSLTEYAHKLKSSLVDCEDNAEWDKEYNRLVPTDFYFRNVEGITAEHAFHMIILQFFAKNEEWMIENGLQVNGELNVYVSDRSTSVQDLLNRIIKYWPASIIS